MYVVSAPRSNSTEFCLKYSFDNDKQYVGELTYAIANPFKEDAQGSPFINKKREFHETGIQPSYNIPTLVTNWMDLNNPNTLSLIRINDNLPLYDNAAFLITRKNIREQLISLVDFRFKVLANISPNAGVLFDTFTLMNYCSMIIPQICVMLQYAKVYSKPITWTEDFSTPSTNHTYFNAWENKTEFLFLLDRQLAKIDFAAFSDQIITS